MVVAADLVGVGVTVAVMVVNQNTRTFTHSVYYFLLHVLVIY
jgi:hypothetical protein